METQNENVFVVYEEYMNNGDVQVLIAGVATTMEKARKLMTDWALNARGELLEKFDDDEIIREETPTSIYQNIDFDDCYSFISIVEKRLIR